MTQKRPYDDLYRALLPQAGSPQHPEAAHRAPVGRIARVDAGSPAEMAGLQPHDEIVSVDESTLHDVIDWRWFSDGPVVTLVVRDQQNQERAVVLERQPGQTWGIEFDQLVFDHVRHCRNECMFCFVRQLPPGLRRSLYVRDDDYRLSFLQGNFITLTNLTDADMARIDEQHLSPLYVSLHSADPVVRRQLMCARTDHALERFDELVEAGIDLHVQIVLVPGENDGSRLDHTLNWLAMRDGVRSVGVVPVGYTKQQHHIQRSYESRREAAAVIDQLEPWREAFLERDNVSWVHAADELYMNADRPLPAAHQYDGFPQLENGVGLVRRFVDDLEDGREELSEIVDALRSSSRPSSVPSAAVTVVTGALFGSLIDSLVSDSGWDDVVGVLAVPNAFFGGNVSVSGLLTGSDLTDALKASGSTGVFLLPDTLANHDGVTLDDVLVTDLGGLTGKDVRLVSSDARGLLEGLRSAVEMPARPRI